MDFRRQVALLVIGGFIGTAIGAAINALTASGPIFWDERTAPFTAGVFLLGLLATTRTIGPIKHVLSSTRGIRVEGNWVGHFEYEKSGQVVRIEESLSIRQTGTLLRGRSTSTRIDGDFPVGQTTYEFTATLARDATFTGSWRSITAHGRYHGLFLGRISRHGGQIDGVWIGIEEPRSRKGDFRWTKAG